MRDWLKLNAAYLVVLFWIRSHKESSCILKSCIFFYFLQHDLAQVSCGKILIFPMSCSAHLFPGDIFQHRENLRVPYNYCF